jgi:hypothetical protein
MEDGINHPLVQALANSDLYDGAKVFTARSVSQLGSIAAVKNSDAATAYAADPARLHGDKPPGIQIATEKPHHRLMIYCHAKGMTAREIGEQMGFDPLYVNTVLRQPWARQQIVALLNEVGESVVSHFLKQEVSPSLEVLREIRDKREAKDAARIAAANSILDRCLGKPTVHLESDNTNRQVPSDIVRLDAEIESVRKQLTDSGHSSDANARN